MSANSMNSISSWKFKIWQRKSSRNRAQ